MRINFDEIAIWDERKGVCSGCGLTRKRKLKFWQTESPFNKNPDGTIRTRDEIRDAVKQDMIASRERPFVCAKCDKTGRDNGN